jgi:hypothetical protein
MFQKVKCSLGHFIFLEISPWKKNDLQFLEQDISEVSAQKPKGFFFRNELIYLEEGKHAVHDVWCIIGTSTMIVASQFQHFFYAKYLIVFSKKSDKIREKQIKRNIYSNILQRYY